MVDAGHRAHACQQHAVDGRARITSGCATSSTRHFAAAPCSDMEPHIQAIGDELAGELFAEGSPADLVERFARKLPLSVICELLGLPLADRPKFMAWAGGFTRFTGALGFLSHDARTSLR